MYQKLREHEPRCVEVYKYENRNVHMKYIDGVPLRDKLSLKVNYKNNIAIIYYFLGFFFVFFYYFFLLSLPIIP